MDEIDRNGGRECDRWCSSGGFWNRAPALPEVFRLRLRRGLGYGIIWLAHVNTEGLMDPERMTVALNDAGEFFSEN